MNLKLKNPAVMGILNITPDSFSDGGKFFIESKTNLDLLLKSAAQMKTDGAMMLDVGGESTRPGAQKISVQEELDRVIPVIEKIKKNIDIMISIDTSKAQVMKEAIRAGAGMINDVCALQAEGALQVAAASGVPVCLMHMQGDPQTMQQQPTYVDVVAEVKAFLVERVNACEAAGIARDKIVIDPGFGFGKSLEHNLALLKHLSSFEELHCPLLVGVSRKSLIARMLGREVPVSDRLAGSLALAWACVQQGANIVRVHDVKETVDMLKIHQALQ